MSMPNSPLTSPRRTIWSAAKTGDLDLLMDLLDANKDVPFHAPDDFNTTAFQHSCLFGHSRVAKYLFDLYAIEGMDIPALELEVCIRGCTNHHLRKALLGQCSMDDAVWADYDSQRANSVSMWDAAKEGIVVKLQADLKRFQAKFGSTELITAHDASNFTTLFYACAFDQPAAAMLLLPEFKSLMSADEFAAEMAVCRGATTLPSLLQLLDEAIPMKTLRKMIAQTKKAGDVVFNATPGRRGLPPPLPVILPHHRSRNVWYCAQGGHVDTLRQLVEEDGHRFDATDNNGWTPFMHACWFDRVYILKYLEAQYDTRKVDIPPHERWICERSCTSDDVRSFIRGTSTIDSVIEQRERAVQDAPASVWANAFG